jgi:hypothetical protein
MQNPDLDSAPSSSESGHFQPTLAYQLCALAEQAYWYDTFEPWALANGYKAARGFHEDSIQAKVLCDGTAILIVFTATDLLVLKEWVKYDFDLRRSPMLGGWVHKGFRRALHAGGRIPSNNDAASESPTKMGLFLQINTYVCFELFKQFGELPIYVGGHSLGAAMAKMFLAELAEQERLGKTSLLTPKTITACYTTGEPRIGSTQVAAEIEKCYAGRMHRGIFRRDWVPAVPYKWQGFRHSGYPHFINEAGALAFGTEGPYILRLSGADHLPQRYARSYLNLLRKERGEERVPVIGGFKQFWRDFKEVVFHPGRGNDLKN